MVTQLDLPCLRNVVRLNMSFDQIDHLKDRVKIIVNRVGQDSGQISLKKAQDTLGREIYWQIPNDYRVMVRSSQQWCATYSASPSGGNHAIDLPAWCLVCVAI